MTPNLTAFTGVDSQNLPDVMVSVQFILAIGAGNMIEKDDLTNFLRKSFTYIREPFLVLEVKDNKTAIVYANKKLLDLFACKNMAELTDFAWEKLFPLTTGLSGDHAEL